MDKISKALRRLTAKEREKIKETLVKIKTGDFFGLDLKKLNDREDVFRVRKGNLRIIFRADKNKKIFILAVERRNDNTYS